MFANPSKLYEPDVPKALASEAAAALRPMFISAVADISPGLVTDLQSLSSRGTWHIYAAQKMPVSHWLFRI